MGKKLGRNEFLDTGPDEFHLHTDKIQQDIIKNNLQDINDTIQQDITIPKGVTLSTIVEKVYDKDTYSFDEFQKIATLLIQKKYGKVVSLKNTKGNTAIEVEIEGIKNDLKIIESLNQGDNLIDQIADYVYKTRLGYSKDGIDIDAPLVAQSVVNSLNEAHGFNEIYSLKEKLQISANDTDFSGVKLIEEIKEILGSTSVDIKTIQRTYFAILETGDLDE